MKDESKHWAEIKMLMPRKLVQAAIEVGRKHAMTGEQWCRLAVVQALKAEGHRLPRRKPKTA